MSTRLRIRTMALAALLLVSSLASGHQDRARGGDRLVLRERRIDVTIVENVAVIQHVFKVGNPSDRLLEGKVSFDLPEGAVACDLTLLRNIASTDRRAKIMSPARASALYDLAKRRDLSLEEADRVLETLTAVAAGRPDPRPRLPGSAPAPSTGSERGGDEGGGTAREETPRSGGGVSAPSEPEPETPVAPEPPADAPPVEPPPFQPPPMEPPPPTAPPMDPAVLEAVSGGFRLKFFPVPAFGEETVTAVFAVEVKRRGDLHEIAVPLRVETSFARDAKVQETLALYLSSDRPIARAESRTHALPEAGRSRNTRHAQLPIEAKGRVFELSYGLDASALPYDLKEKTDWAKVAPRDPRGEISLKQAVTALRAVEAMDGIGAERAREIAGIAGVVSRHSSLIVIERREVRELEAQLPAEAQEAPMAGAEGCDYVRLAAGFPKARGEAGCERHVEMTTDVAKIEAAKRDGLKTWASKEMPTFTCIESVRHRAGCAVKECRPSVLQKAAESLKK